ncbi:Transcriptional repressor MprA [compost metagenome]
MTSESDFFKPDEVEKRIRKIAELLPNLDLSSMRTLMTFIYTSQEVYNNLSSKLSDYGLSVGKLKILMPLLSDDRAWTPSELAAYSGVTRSTMTSVIDGLEREGFITRGSLDDRRMTSIRLTEKGREVMLTMSPQFIGQISGVMEEFTPEDHEMFVVLLHKLFNGLERIKNS